MQKLFSCFNGSKRTAIPESDIIEGCKYVCGAKRHIKRIVRFLEQAPSFDRTYLCFDALLSGVTTDAVDAAVHQYLISQGAYPAAINFFGFPKSICASVNEGKPYRICLLNCSVIGCLRPASVPYVGLLAMN